ncbi:MAG: NupC/NupG family nucleoside CNT transporter [Brevinema sp.]
MRFMGILGILFFVGMSILFSKNRKAINWRTVSWGLGLQILFAFILLGNNILSFIASGLLLALIFVYIACTHQKTFTFLSTVPKYVLSAIAILKLAVIIAIGYFMGTTIYDDGVIRATITPFINILWILFVISCILHKYIAKTKFGKLPINSSIFLFNVALSFGGTIALAVATNFQEGTMYHHLSRLSISFGNFLTIPTAAGASFVYGPLADIGASGFIFFIQVLSTIVFFSAFISILYYVGIVQVFITEIAKFMRWTMKTSGAETLSCSANIFVGQTEAPVLIKPFVPDMTDSELHAIMTAGFATISGAVFAGFVASGIDASYLIGASTMSAPAALMISKIWYPETKRSVTEGDTEIPQIKTSDSLVGAAAVGTSDGIQLAINVGGMLLSFIALIKLLNLGIDFVFPGVTLEIIFAQIFQYLAIIMGVPMQDIHNVGTLLGLKIAINEFVAYSHLADLIKQGMLTQKSQVIATYALCGFANFSSIAIQVGGLSYLAPSRRDDIARLGFTAMVAGAFASWLTACIAGILLG